MKSYKATCELFEKFEVTEKIYEGGNTSKPHLGKTLTVPVMAGNEKEEKPP